MWGRKRSCNLRPQSMSCFDGDCSPSFEPSTSAAVNGAKTWSVLINPGPTQVSRRQYMWRWKVEVWGGKESELAHSW